MFAGKDHPLQWALPQTPELADLPWAKRQISTTGGRVGAIATDLVTSKGTARLWIKCVQADQHLIDHLLVAKGLQQAGVIARDVDDHICAAFKGRLDPHHPQPSVAVNLAREARLALPHRRLELEHDLVAPTVVGGPDRSQMLSIQRRSQLYVAKRAQRYRQHHVIGLITHRADLYGDAVLVLADGRDFGAGLEHLDLFEHRLGKHRTAARQSRRAEITIIGVLVNPSLLGEIQQRQARRLIITGADLLIDQLPRSGWQVELVEPARDSDLIEGKQRRVGRRVEWISDRARQLIAGLLVALQRLGGIRLFGGQVGGGKILAIDQVARGTHVFRRGHSGQLERLQVLVQHRLHLGVADPLTGSQTRATAH